MRTRLLIGLAVASLAGSAAVVSFAMLPRAPELLPTPELPQSWEPYIPRGTAEHEAVLVRMYRGRMQPALQEVSITTIFRDESFTVVGDEDITGDSDADLAAHLEKLFSLEEVVSLGSSLVPLSGGSALVNDGWEIHVEGQRVGDRAVRLIVWKKRDGEGVVATSVITRRGKTIVLAGSSSTRAGDDGPYFVCLTPL